MNSELRGALMNGFTLENCPFCGSSAVYLEKEKDYPPKFYVRCGQCFACGSYDERREVAISSWNHRATVTPDALHILSELTWKIGQLEKPIDGTWKDAKDECYNIVEKAHSDITSGRWRYNV